METTRIGNNEVSYEELLKSAAVQLMPAEQNKGLLSEVPHQRIEDLALIFTDGAGNPVTNQNLQDFGISADQFQKEALEAAAQNHPAMMITMEQALGIPADVLPEKATGEPQLYVVSNDQMNLGAGAIAYPGFLDQAAEKAGGDFYVLPSSIHEVLVMPETKGISLEDLNATVRSVNAQEVAPEEQLSDHVYHYDRKERILEQAEKFEARQQAKMVERPKEKESILKNLQAEKQSKATKFPERNAKPKMRSGREEVL